jgi:hypothetical protein
MIQNCDWEVHNLVLISRSWLLTFHNEISIRRNEFGIYYNDIGIMHSWNGKLYKYFRMVHNNQLMQGKKVNPGLPVSVCWATPERLQDPNVKIRHVLSHTSEPFAGRQQPPVKNACKVLGKYYLGQGEKEKGRAYLWRESLYNRYMISGTDEASRQLTNMKTR